MKTIKLSYSILNAWSSGNFEQAISQYLGKPWVATPAMELGKLKDELWSTHAEFHRELHPELGGDKLDRPAVQVKYEKIIPFSADFQILLRGVPDTVDGATLYEYKCGMTTAGQYIDKLQMDYYRLLLPDLTIGFYLCFNPYNNTLSKGVKYLHRSNAETAMEHVITFGGEIIDYLQANKLVKDFRG